MNPPDYKAIARQTYYITTHKHQYGESATLQDWHSTTSMLFQNLGYSFTESEVHATKTLAAFPTCRLH